uniref:Mitotic spindle assembly checkpoint protein MAD1 n=1 Tax=Strongyloides papillosus TaxID=174720 RepID=A0A0N5C3G3_STREA
MATIENFNGDELILQKKELISNEISRPNSRASVTGSISGLSNILSTRKRPFAYSSGSERILTSRFLEAKEEISRLKEDLANSKNELEKLQSYKKENSEKLRLLTLDVESLKYELEREKSKKLIDNEKLLLRNELRDCKVALKKTVPQIKKLEAQIDGAKEVLMLNNLWTSTVQTSILKKSCFVKDEFIPSNEAVNEVIRTNYEETNGFTNKDDLQEHSTMKEEPDTVVGNNKFVDSIAIYKTKFDIPECSLNSYEETICSQRKKIEKLDNDYAILKRAYNKEKQRGQDVEMLTVKCNKLESQLEIQRNQYESLSKQNAELQMGISRDVFREYSGKNSFKTESELLRKIVAVQVENKRLKGLLKDNNISDDSDGVIMLHLKNNLVTDAQKEMVKEQLASESGVLSCEEKQKLLDEIKKWKEIAEKRERERDAAAGIVNSIMEFRKIVKSLFGYDIKIKNNIAELVFAENPNDVFQVQFDLTSNNFNLLESETTNKVKFSIDKYLNGKNSLPCFLAGAFIELYHYMYDNQQNDEYEGSSTQVQEWNNEDVDEEEGEEEEEYSDNNFEDEEYSSTNGGQTSGDHEVEEILILSDDE